jgi:transcriptional regulator with XRE-family HTH domain
MNSQPKRTPRAVERAIHRSTKTLERLIVQTPDEVEETQSVLGSTPCEVSERLRDADEVLKRIIRKQAEDSEPTAFGKTIALLRTQSKLSVDELARRTELDIEDIIDIENNPDLEPDPMIVVVLAEYFHVPVEKMQRLAGLTQQCDLGDEFGSLHLAAGARPEFDQHTREEKLLLLRWIKQFRK